MSTKSNDGSITIRARQLALMIALGVSASACSNAVSPNQGNEPEASFFRVIPAGPTVLKIESRPIASPGGPAQKMAELKQRRLLRSGSPGKSSALLSSVVSPILSSRVTFAKAAIFNRQFLYGSDLQYSTIGEDDGMLMQSIAIGHVTAKFQILGDRLQLIAEERYRFESETNIPTQLLHEWPILHQTANEITIDIVKASTALSALFGSQSPARASWVRSVDFVSDGSYLMIESSVELADGKVAEFMESVFPRETLVNPAVSPVYDDPSIQPMAARFGFLSDALWLSTPDGRVRTAVASRFSPPAPGQTIDWYATPNTPPEFLPAIKAGIEGWNRYSQKMWARDFISFKGLLPAGVKIGDPRYNIVNWDSVADASSAYESQASDPETGIQSHSLIYLPYSWVKIGQEFWETGRLTQDRTQTLKAAIDQTQFLGRNVQVPCFSEGEHAAIRIEMRDSPEKFSKDLLRGVLFHEVGHALGLAHNFKGSLEWDPDQKDSLFTSSIMDYSQYAIEGAAFDDIDLASGPILEYDRQAISALYNEGKDIAATDAVVPFCDDGAADSRAGGVDPLCLRYDAGRDPGIYVEKTLQLIQDPAATLGKTKSLAAAAEELLTTLGDPALVATELDLQKKEMVFRNQLFGVIQYYFSAGSQGLNFALSTNLRSLLTFRAGTLTPGLDAVLLRSRIAGVMDEVMKLEKFSPATHAAFEKVGDKAAQWTQKTAWYQSADASVRAQKEAAIKAATTQALQTFEVSLIPRVRARQIQALARTSTAPFFFAPPLDYEARALDWLETILIDGRASGEAYTTSEKVAAAQTIATFEPLQRASEIKAAARALVENDIRHATSAEERESLRALLGLL